MRDLRFRFWNIPKKRWYGRSVSIYKTHFGSLEPDEYIIEQFTGLKDKNGKEIYEGDICGYGEIHNNGIVKCGSFRYMDGDLNPYQIGYYFQRTKQTCSDDTCQDSLDQTNIEVIGNIHENPELCS